MATNRRLVLVAVLADAALLGLLAVISGWGAVRAGLVLGVPLLPGLYQRMDVVAAAVALAALGLLARQRSRLAGATATVGFLVKTWPLVAAAGWVARGRRTFVVSACLTLAVALAAWLCVAGVAGPRQVATFRGATGWQLESTPGLVEALTRGGRPRFEEGAWRVGQSGAAARLALSAVPLAAFAAVARTRWRAGPGGHPLTEDALASLVLVAALLVASPLFSPQFLAWLLPWAALAWAGGARRPATFVGGAGLLTAATTAGWPPEALGHVLPASALLARNVLVALAALDAYRWLAAASPVTGTAASAGPSGGLGRLGAGAHGANARSRRSARWPA